jgi:PIN domain nuclease of toxin-antitoxin system
MTSLPLFCIDTHAIYWWRNGSPSLSGAAAQVFDDGIQGKAILVVPYVVIAELFYLLVKHRQVGLFAPLLADLQTLPYYRPESLAFGDLEALDTIPEIPEMHDRLIALTAKRLSATIVTKDKTIRASSQVKCLW